MVGKENTRHGKTGFIIFEPEKGGILLVLWSGDGVGEQVKQCGRPSGNMSGSEKNQWWQTTFHEKNDGLA